MIELLNQLVHWAANDEARRGRCAADGRAERRGAGGARGSGDWGSVRGVQAHFCPKEEAFSEDRGGGRGVDAAAAERGRLQSFNKRERSLLCGSEIGLHLHLACVVPSVLYQLGDASHLCHGADVSNTLQWCVEISNLHNPGWAVEDESRVETRVSLPRSERGSDSRAPGEKVRKYRELDAL